MKKYLAIVLCVGIAVVATWVGGMQKVVGSPMIGLFIGMLIVNLMPSVDKDFKAGTTFAGKKFLNWGIIMAGATLNFSQVLGYGAKALPLIVANICLSFAVAFLVGRKLLGMSSNTCTLVGGGTCICGGTAIATLASIIKAREEEIAYAMTAIFLFDIFAALLYPYLADWIHLSANQFGFLAGTAINDTSSVVAAEATYNLVHGLNLSNAITVKLTRTTMLIVLAVIFTVLTVKREAGAARDEGGRNSIGKTVMKVFPWFIVAFLAMAVLNTLGLFNQVDGLPKFFSKGYKFLVTAALAGVGFKVQFKDLFTRGVRPILLGGCTWLAVALSSLTFVFLFAKYINNAL